ncbi:MAG: tripartite tricarboxylate transporter substrate binding protein [Pseudomonadota bacterium]
MTLKFPSMARLAVAALMGATLASAHAQSGAYPQKPVRIFVAAPAGSAPDLIARILSEKLASQLGQPVIIENRPGANGIVAMNALKAAAPDGYTIAMPQAAVVAVTPFTYKDAHYNVERDFETFAIVATSPMLFVTNMSNPAKNLADAAAAAKAAPDRVAIGNPTRTSIPHLAAELAGLKTNAKFQQVSFATTGQGIQAVVNGDTAFYVDGVGPLIQLVKSGRLRALAVASETELPGLEGIPLANKSLPGLNVSGWFSMQAPKGTPAAILQRLNNEVKIALQLPDVVAKFRDFGTYPTPGSVADAQKFIKGEIDQFSGVIRTLGLKPE